MKTSAIFIFAVFCTLLLCSEAQLRVRLQQAAEQKKVEELVESQKKDVEETTVEENEARLLNTTILFS